MTEKLNVTNVFNRAEEVTTSASNKNLEYNSSEPRKEQYHAVLGANVVDIEKLKQLAWNGVPAST